MESLARLMGLGLVGLLGQKGRRGVMGQCRVGRKGMLKP